MSIHFFQPWAIFTLVFLGDVCAFVMNFRASRMTHALRALRSLARAAPNLRE